MEERPFPITNKVIVYFFNAPGEPIYGKIYSIYYDTFMEFCGVLQLLWAMESLFDTLSMPQAAYTNQHYPVKKPRKKDGKEKIERYAEKEGLAKEARASFVIDVVYRQNNTWQGTLTWVGSNTSCYFKSVFELLKLIDEVVNSSDPIEYVWNAE